MFIVRRTTNPSICCDSTPTIRVDIRSNANKCSRDPHLSHLLSTACALQSAAEDFREFILNMISHTSAKIQKRPFDSAVSDHWFTRSSHLLAHFTLDRPYLEMSQSLRGPSCLSVQQIVAAAVAHVLFNKCWSGLSKYLRFSDDGSVDFDAEGFVAFFEQSEAEVDGEDEDADSADSMVFPCFDDEITLDARQQKERKAVKRFKTCRPLQRRSHWTPENSRDALQVEGTHAVCLHHFRPSCNGCVALLIVLGFLLGIFAICTPVQLVCAIMIVVSARARLAIIVCMYSVLRAAQC